MQVLWKLEKGFVRDIIEKLPEPKPAYNTVSTIVRILEKKGFASHESYGKSHRYFPLMKKEDYSKKSLRKLVRDYFGNSLGSLVSSFSEGNNLSLAELEELRELMEKQIEEKKNE